MANEEQVAILKQGVKAWNEWREKNPDAKIDLSWADLFDASLSGVDLHLADISGANFLMASLSGAILFDADLNGADLSRADLSGADLNRANLTGADLSDADLNGADLSQCTFAITIVGNVDLSTAKGLESIKHLLPSTIGIDTIYKSKGKIPEVFLRGTGVPENFFTFMHSLTGKVFDFYSCFISYSSKDEDFAKRLHADLHSKGVRVWFAPEALKIGDKFRTRIDEAIRVYDKLLIVLSENSINSTWVEKEVEAAFEKEQQQKRTMLFPVRLDDAVMHTNQAWAADIRRQRHIGDMTRWKEHDHYQAGFDRLLRDLQAGDSKAT